MSSNVFSSYVGALHPSLLNQEEEVCPRNKLIVMSERQLLTYLDPELIKYSLLVLWLPSLCQSWGSNQTFQHQQDNFKCLENSGRQVKVNESTTNLCYDGINYNPAGILLVIIS